MVNIINYVLIHVAQWKVYQEAKTIYKFTESAGLQLVSHDLIVAVATSGCVVLMVSESTWYIIISQNYQYGLQSKLLYMWVWDCG